MSQISLQTPIRYLKGVGPEKSKILSRLELETVEDLFTFFPRRYENRFPVKPVSEITTEGKECVIGSVLSRGIIRTSRGQSIFKVVVSDGKAVLFGTWFNQPYLAKLFPPKSRVIFYGKAEKAGKHLQMLHPEYEILKGEDFKDSIHVGRIVPVYPLTEELNQKGLRRLLFQAVSGLPWLLKEPLPLSFRKRTALADRVFAFKQIHFPSTLEDYKKAYRRLVFDEFFLMQLVIQLKKMKLRKESSELLHSEGEGQVRRFIQSLDFSLTAGQQEALRDILDDMKSLRTMNRLVQGDVGSGKTVVAAASLLFTVHNGFQGVLMAPTEVLAQQHTFKLTQLLEPFGVVCGYLAQETRGPLRKETLARIESGDIQVIVGTHALLGPDVKFRRLGLAVVDEQHKFGVFQRSALKAKGGEATHFLLMTATPIPRTLAMTLYGELDISTIRELPEGRRPVTTFWVGENKRAEIYKLLDRQIAEGGQGYVICPLIEGADVSAKGVLAAYHDLTAIFSNRKIGILHGRMRSDEKKKVMNDFKDRRLELLVATVVIEVGIDVPNATIMIIENAEKFGLAQLHQLRGRVGRGRRESVCVLFSDTPTPESLERLQAFEDSEGGFDIAQRDLDLRGAGDLIGKKQHGLPILRIGDFVKDGEVLELARREAKETIENDPSLEKKENRPLRHELEKRYRLWRDKLTVTA